VPIISFIPISLLFALVYGKLVRKKFYLSNSVERRGFVMRRLAVYFTALLLLFSLAVPVCASTDVSKLSSFCTVSSDGSCHIAMTVTIHIEQAVDKLYFPIPGNATGVSLNGSRVSASKSGEVRRINLSRLARNVVGDVTASIQYSLHDVIHTTEAGTLEMQVPLLAGFEYPVELLEFSVSLPGAVNVLPGFVSGYHQARIEEDLTYNVDGATVTGTSVRALKDHETLTMTMAVTEEMFPRSIVQTQNYDMGITAMWICGAAALLYWLIAMWNLPVWPQSCTEPPQGFNAGQLGSIAAGQGTDLSLMVLSWAQLGYILIYMDRHNRVVLHRQMDMGNERSEFEQRCFHKLFGKRQSVDTAGYQYAQLCRTVGKRADGMKELLNAHTGNPRVFRVLASGIGLFGGGCLAVALAGGAALQGLLIFVLAIAGSVSGWFIQDFGAAVFLRHRRKRIASLVVSGFWLLLSLVADAFSVGLQMVGLLLVAGILLAWGGRRTALGRQTLAQVQGLKRYLRTADKAQLQRICETDPDYFFRLAPCALALGRDEVFARQFGNKKLDRCPYLTTGTDGQMTAQQWSAIMRRAVDAMNDRAEKLPLEKLLGMIHSMTRR
jgi:hypothetical protein